ncbi:hypothetical protein Mal4_52260 [Maioricimonas rarisocia]|uniref:Sulfatase n=1 Tax=Maioricimonas rarisocia TaxID=2528026 RepID=A0A517ZEE5_9PLAN|nr:DUF1501 domain-containing protein [Maioricimonas rarisocia]QDU40863.1 hypothetical protein Mal4_52260 [Maioricimonas rarisocia]
MPRPHGTSRRTFLVASTLGLAGSSLAPTRQAAAAADSATGGRAKSTILFFLCGGASHIDMWDMKPEAPAEYRGPFAPIATSAPGVRLCEHLPLLARQAHHLALINSVGATVNTNDHHAGYYYNLTGHVPDITFRTLGNNRTPFPDDWPFMGSVVASRRPRHAYLPNSVALPHMPSRKPYTRPGQFAARLGVEHDSLYLNGSRENPLKFHAPSLSLQEGIDTPRLNSRRELLSAIDEARRSFDATAATQTWNRQIDRALSLLASSRTTAAFDVSQEPESVRERYGDSVNAMSLLLARRLVEAGVPFITVFWLGTGVGSPLAKKCRSAGSWDTHGNNFNCLKDSLLPEFDRGFSALVEDLADRGLLDETMLLVTSEMGRKPKIGDPRSGGVSGAGRDHWTHCLTDVVAGGGIEGGRTFGASDRFAEYPADHPVTPADVAKTVWHGMGIDDLIAYDSQNRPYQLLDEGEPIYDLF